MGEGLIGGLSDFLGLDAILDPGAADRARGLNQEQAATDLWLSAMGDTPTADQLYNPQTYVNGGRSQMEGVRPGVINDAVGQQAQMRALQQMQGIADGGGYTDIERGQIQQAQFQAAQQEKSQRDAVVQQAQMRGMGGGGASLAAQLQAQQSGANRASADATNIATAAQMRALQAMQGAGNIGQQQQGNALARQGQQFNQAAGRASALDQFNQANTVRRQGVNNANAAAQTAATQGAWDNRVGILAGATQQHNTNSQNATTEANRQAGLVSGLVGSIIS